MLPALSPQSNSLRDLAAGPSVEHGELEDGEIALRARTLVEHPAPVEQEAAQLAMEATLLGRGAAVLDQLGQGPPIGIEVDQKRAPTSFLSGASTVSVHHHTLADPTQVVHHLSLVVAPKGLRAALEQAAVDVLDQIVDDFRRGPLVQPPQDPGDARAQEGLEPEHELAPGEIVASSGRAVGGADPKQLDSRSFLHPSAPRLWSGGAAAGRRNGSQTYGRGRTVTDRPGARHRRALGRRQKVRKRLTFRRLGR